MDMRLMSKNRPQFGNLVIETNVMGSKEFSNTPVYNYVSGLDVSDFGTSTLISHLQTLIKWFTTGTIETSDFFNSFLTVILSMTDKDNNPLFPGWEVKDGADEHQISVSISLAHLEFDIAALGTDLNA